MHVCCNISKVGVNFFNPSGVMSGVFKLFDCSFNHDENPLCPAILLLNSSCRWMAFDMSQTFHG